MLDKIQKKNSSSVNSSETSEFQEYIMGPWAKNQKTNCHPLQLPALPPSIMPPKRSWVLHSCQKLLEQILRLRLELICWNGRENLTYGFLFLQKGECFGKRQLFSKKVVGWCWFCWTSLWNFQEDMFFRSLYQKSAGKGHHIRWAPGNGRDVGRVGQFTPSDALAKTKAISAYDMWVFIGWDWCVFLDPRRFILAIHSESPMQRLIQDSASTQPQRASLCLWCRMAEASRYHVMSCHLTFQSHHNFHHSTAERCFCKVTPGHSLEADEVTALWASHTSMHQENTSRSFKSSIAEDVNDKK